MPASQATAQTEILRAPVHVDVATATGERRRKPFPWGTVLVHALLILSVAVIAFPLYFAFTISTQSLHEVVQKPPRLLPSEIHASSPAAGAR